MRACLLPLAVVVLVLAACSSNDGASDPTTTGGCKEGRRLTLVAEANRWDAGCLTAPAGRITIEVDNRDEGGNHNVHLPDAPGSPASDPAQGPSTQQLEVTLAAGTYEFICDLHPNMVGTLTVR